MSQSKFKPIQMNPFDFIYALSDRTLRQLENDWTGNFNRGILPELVKLESMFEPLYLSKANFYRGIPTYLDLARLILKVLFNLTDQELEKECQELMDPLLSVNLSNGPNNSFLFDARGKNFVLLRVQPIRSQNKLLTFCINNSSIFFSFHFYV